MVAMKFCGLDLQQSMSKARTARTDQASSSLQMLARRRAATSDKSSEPFLAGSNFLNSSYIRIRSYFQQQTLFTPFLQLQKVTALQSRVWLSKHTQTTLPAPSCRCFRAGFPDSGLLDGCPLFFLELRRTSRFWRSKIETRPELAMSSFLKSVCIYSSVMSGKARLRISLNSLRSTNSFSFFFYQFCLPLISSPRSEAPGAFVRSLSQSPSISQMPSETLGYSLEATGQGSGI